MKKYEPVLYNRIKEFSNKNRISFHMPVHSSGKLYEEDFSKGAFDFDLTELDYTDNLAAPEDVIDNAHKNMAELFGADNAHMLVGGSSAGIHAMLMSCLNRGDTLLVDRCAHISIINACIMYGIVPVFIDRKMNEEYMIADSLTEDELKEAIKKKPDAKAIIITSPTYYGICSPIDKLSELAHENGMVLLVDAAHGSHFAFSDRLPDVPVSAGADMCVMSLHKTLGAPTQTALLLHKSALADYDRVKSCLNMVHTTSPSYILMCAADYVCARMADDGNTLVSNMIDMTMLAKQEIEKSTKCKCLTQKAGDISRLVINFSAYNITGCEIAGRLDKRYSVDVEMADLCNLVCITSPFTSKDDILCFTKAVKEITDLLDETKAEAYNICVSPIETEKNPSEVFFSDKEYIPLDDGEGKISAGVVSVYPPGAAVLVPGAKIGSDTIECIKKVIRAGGKVTGLADGKISVQTAL